MKRSQNRKLAKFKGELTYHGSPCKKCGTTLRYVSCPNCVECNRSRNQYQSPESKQRHVEYMREYQRQPHIREYQKEYHKTYRK